MIGCPEILKYVASLSGVDPCAVALAVTGVSIIVTTYVHVHTLLVYK